MKKRGISPLIATVLIIGFTIILAALVMQWGGGLFNKIKGESGENAEKALACSNVNLNIVGAKTDFFNSKSEISVENLAEQEISGFVIRLIGENGVDSTSAEKILKLGELQKISDIKFNIIKTGLVDNVEIFPKIIIKDKEFTCDNKFIKNVLNYDSNGLEIVKIWKVWDDDSITQIPGILELDTQKYYSGSSSLRLYDPYLDANGQASGWRDENIPIVGGSIPMVDVDFLTYTVSAVNAGSYHFIMFQAPSGYLYTIGSNTCALPGAYGGWATDIAGINWKTYTVNMNNPISQYCTPVNRPTSTTGSITLRSGFGATVYFDSIYFYNVKK